VMICTSDSIINHLFFQLRHCLRRWSLTGAVDSVFEEDDDDEEEEEEASSDG